MRPSERFLADHLIYRGRRSTFLSTEEDRDGLVFHLHQSGHAGRKRPASAAEATVLYGITNAEFPHFFLHADGGRNVKVVRREQVEPALGGLRTELPEAGEGVGVIPVLEMESRALADGDALRDVFGLSLTDEELGIDMARARLDPGPPRS